MDEQVGKHSKVIYGYLDLIKEPPKSGKTYSLSRFPK